MASLESMVMAGSGRVHHWKHKPQWFGVPATPGAATAPEASEPEPQGVAMPSSMLPVAVAVAPSTPAALQSRWAPAPFVR